MLSDRQATAAAIQARVDAVYEKEGRKDSWRCVPMEAVLGDARMELMSKNAGQLIAALLKEGNALPKRALHNPLYRRRRVGRRADLSIEIWPRDPLLVVDILPEPGSRLIYDKNQLVSWQGVSVVPAAIPNKASITSVAEEVQRGKTEPGQAAVRFQGTRPGGVVWEDQLMVLSRVTFLIFRWQTIISKRNVSIALDSTERCEIAIPALFYYSVTAPALPHPVEMSLPRPSSRFWHRVEHLVLNFMRTILDDAPVTVQLGNYPKVAPTWSIAPLDYSEERMEASLQLVWRAVPLLCTLENRELSIPHWCLSVPTEDPSGRETFGFTVRRVADGNYGSLGWAACAYDNDDSTVGRRVQDQLTYARDLKLGDANPYLFAQLQSLRPASDGATSASDRSLATVLQEWAIVSLGKTELVVYLTIEAVALATPAASAMESEDPAPSSEQTNSIFAAQAECCSWYPMTWTRREVDTTSFFARVAYGHLLSAMFLRAGMKPAPYNAQEWHQRRNATNGEERRIFVLKFEQDVPFIITPSSLRSILSQSNRISFSGPEAPAELAGLDLEQTLVGAQSLVQFLPAASRPEETRQSLSANLPFAMVKAAYDSTPIWHASIKEQVSVAMLVLRCYHLATGKGRYNRLPDDEEIDVHLPVMLYDGRDVAVELMPRGWPGQATLNRCVSYTIGLFLKEVKVPRYAYQYYVAGSERGFCKVIVRWRSVALVAIASTSYSKSWKILVPEAPSKRQAFGFTHGVAEHLGDVDALGHRVLLRETQADSEDLEAEVQEALKNMPFNLHLREAVADLVGIDALPHSQGCRWVNGCKEQPMLSQAVLTFDFRPAKLKVRLVIPAVVI